MRKEKGQSFALGISIKMEVGRDLVREMLRYEGTWLVGQTCQSPPTIVPWSSEGLTKQLVERLVTSESRTRTGELRHHMKAHALLFIFQLIQVRAEQRKSPI